MRLITLIFAIYNLNKVVVINESRPISEESAQRHAAGWAGNVALRFEVYAQTEPLFDIYNEAYIRLGLRGNERIVDIGSYDGALIQRLEPIHHGELIGIETDRTAMGNYHNRSKVRFYEKSASNLPGADGSVDVLMSNFQMYFGENQAAYLREFKRVLKEDGKLLVMTSGDFNKVRQRTFEERSAAKKNRKAPPRMNARFDTDIAVPTLTEAFKNVYHGSYHGYMIFRSAEQAVKYYHSFLSMKDFFEPPLNEEELLEVYNDIVAPAVNREIEMLGSFVDYIQRDFFICNDDPYGLCMYDPRTGQNALVKGYVLEWLGANFAMAQ